MSRRNRPVSPARAVPCVCGRVCAGRAGLATHGRACPIERARSRAFVEGIEHQLDRAVADEHIARAVAAARDGRPHPLVPRPVLGRCHCGRPIFRAGVIECAEHDDPPALDR